MPTVYIIIYSVYHHIYTLAKEVQKGLESEGVTVKLFQVPETLSDEVLSKLNAPPKPDIPIISVGALAEADAFLFGIPTRFGTLPSQMKSFLDATGALWATGALSGKFVGTFFSSASQHGGQETTAYTLLTYFAHHGLNYIPLGYPNSHMFDNGEVVGGSPYGAGTIANGDGSRLPTDKEKDIAKTQGELFAKLLNTYHRGLEIVKKESSKSTADSAVANTTEPSTTPAPVESSSAGKEETAAPTTEEPQKNIDEPIAPVSETTRQVDENPTTSNNNENKNVSKSASKTKSKKEKKSSKCFCM